MVTAFINQTGTIGVIYQAIYTNVTGSEFLTLLFLVVLCMLFVMLFRMPIEASVVIVLPMLIVFAAFNNNLFSLLGVVLIYSGILLAKNWFLK